MGNDSFLWSFRPRNRVNCWKSNLRCSLALTARAILTASRSTIKTALILFGTDRNFGNVFRPDFYTIVVGLIILASMNMNSYGTSIFLAGSQICLKIFTVFTIDSGTFLRDFLVLRHR